MVSPERVEQTMLPQSSANAGSATMALGLHDFAKATGRRALRRSTLRRSTLRRSTSWLLAMTFALIGCGTMLALPAQAAGATFYVDDNFANPTVGQDPDGAGPAQNFGTDSFATIQAAVNAASAGDTVRVAAGTYSELVSVTKSLTLLGAQAGVDARDAGRTGLPASESVVRGSTQSGGTRSTSFYLNTNDIVVDGFTAQEATNNTVFGCGVLLGISVAGTEFRNNIVQNNILGMVLSNTSAVNQAIIERNVFRNNNQPGSATGTGIYAEAISGTLTNVLIDDNRFEDNTGSGGIVFASHTAGAQSNITMSDNVFDGNSRALLAFNLVNSSFQTNEVYNSTTTNSDIVLLEGVNNLSLTNNILAGSSAPLGVGIANTGTGSPDATGITFKYNSVTGYSSGGLALNAGDYSGTLDAEINWWGDASGPTHPTNPSGTGQTIVDPDAVVDCLPFLSDGTDTEPGTIGFQPDITPNIAIDDVAISEGDAGTTNLVFTLSRTGFTGLSSTVQIDTQDDTATAPGDYTPIVAGTVTFAAGETSQTLSVTINGDTTNEVDETFFVNLSNPTNATIDDAQGVGTIVNDDFPSLSITNAPVTEGNSGTVDAVFTVTLSAPSLQTVTVQYATATSGSLPATADVDYVSVPLTTLTFAPGETTKNIAVAVNGDTLNEANERFVVNLSNPSHATIFDGEGFGIINNDDAVPTLVIGDVSTTEGNAGTTDAVFTISLSAASGKTVSVKYATATPSGLPATPGTDYVAVPLTTVTFAPGETSKNVAVQINGDTVEKDHERFVVRLSSAVNATIADFEALGTIIDDDFSSLTINNVTVTEGNSGTVAANFTITLTPASTRTVTLQYSTGNASANMATAGVDYIAVAPTTVTFAPGETTKNVAVQVIGDTMNETFERFAVNLTNVTNAFVGDGEGFGTITDDDAVPSLRINDISVTEGNAGTTNAVFTVSLSAASGKTVSVKYATTTATTSPATADVDYVSVPLTTLTFAPGETSKTVTILVNGDLQVESNELFRVKLSSVANATIADSEGFCTIVNDDVAPLLFEGDEPSQ